MPDHSNVAGYSQRSTIASVAGARFSGHSLVEDSGA